MRIRLASLLVLTACASPANPDSGSIADASATLDGGADAGSSDAATARPGCAPEALERCAYAPESPLDQRPPVIELVSYTDVTGATRTIEIALRRPLGADGPLPVVLWSHGGADGTASADGVGAAWSRVFTSAGYLFIGIAHRGRDVAERTALCSELGYDAAGCMTFKFLSWDRPHDVRAVLDWLAGPSGPPATSIDLARVAYAGHSAGAGSVMMIAGASRDFAGTLTTLADPRPVAFIACSPQGPGDDGFADTSFDAVARPHLTLSGLGDDTSGVVAENRRIPFTRMMPGDKHLGWIADESARHTTFDFEIDPCRDYAGNHGTDPARCELFRTWLASAALAFLDAYVRGDPEADAYLASDALSILSDGAMELVRR